jgi:hypothetical protein
MFGIGAKRRKLFWLHLIPCCVALCALPYFIPYYAEWLVIGGWFTFSFLIYFILAAGILWFCFDFSLPQVLYFSSAAYAIQHLGDCFQRIIVQNNGMGTPMWQNVLINIAITAAVFFACYFIFVRNIRKFDRHIVNSPLVYSLLLVTVIIVNVISQYMQSVGYDIMDKVFDAIICLLILFMHWVICYTQELVKRNQTMKIVLQMESQQHRMSKENIELINRKCHDLKHQITAIRQGVIEGDKALNTLKHIEDSIVIYDSMLKTGNSALDILLTEKKLLCEKHGIRFSCIADGSLLDFMDEEDIYTLFGNALDNAIEYIIGVGQDDKKVISIKITSKGNMITIHFDNYCGEQLKFKDGLPQTTKGDKLYHGYGIRSIKYVVGKYSGNMSVFVKNDMFNLNIIMPVVNKSQIA